MMASTGNRIDTLDRNDTISSYVIAPIPQGKELENLMKRRFRLAVVEAGALALLLLVAAACVPVPPKAASAGGAQRMLFRNGGPAPM